MKKKSRILKFNPPQASPSLRMAIVLFFLAVCLNHILSCSFSKSLPPGTLDCHKELTTEDHEKIAIRHVEYVNNSRVIVICPGLLQNKDTQAFHEIANSFLPEFDVIAVDFRGHGESSGYFTFGKKEVLDLKSVLDYASTRYSRVGILAFSIGAAITISEVSRYHNVDSLILVAAPSDMVRVEKQFYDGRELLFVLSHWEFKKGIRYRSVDLSERPIEKVARLGSTPVFYIHGEWDAVVGSWHSEELYQRTRGPKKIAFIKEGLHAEKLYQAYPELFTDLCMTWFRDTLPEQTMTSVGFRPQLFLKWLERHPVASRRTP